MLNKYIFAKMNEGDRTQSIANSLSLIDPFHSIVKRKGMRTEILSHSDILYHLCLAYGIT